MPEKKMKKEANQIRNNGMKMPTAKHFLCQGRFLCRQTKVTRDKIERVEAVSHPFPKTFAGSCLITLRELFLCTCHFNKVIGSCVLICLSLCRSLYFYPRLLLISSIKKNNKETIKNASSSCCWFHSNNTVIIKIDNSLSIYMYIYIYILWVLRNGQTNCLIF